jgi:hypothetical protein
MHIAHLDRLNPRGAMVECSEVKFYLFLTEVGKAPTVEALVNFRKRVRDCEATRGPSNRFHFQLLIFVSTDSSNLAVEIL